MRDTLPHHRKKRSTKRIDALAYMVSFLSLGATLDQVRLAWAVDASGVSLAAWALYTLSSCIWFWYGVLHGDRILLTTNALWVLMCAAVILGVVW